MPIVTFPDSSTVEFPDGMSQDAMQQASAEFWDKRSAAAAPEPTLGQKLGSYIPQFAQQAIYGANEGIDKLARGVEGAINLTGLPDAYNPVRPLREWLEGPTMSGSQNPPQTQTQRAFRAGGKAMGETLPYVAAPYAAPMASAAAAPDSLMGRVMQQLLQVGQEAPLANLSAGMGSGYGGQMAAEAFPDSHNARLLGELVGGGATLAYPYVSPTAIAARAGMAGAGIMRRVTGQAAADKAAEFATANLAKGLADPTAQEGLARAQDLRAQIPGFNPSLAESTQVPSIVATQQALEGKASGPALDAIMARRKANEAAVADFAAQAAPQGDQSPEEIIGAATRRMETLKSATMLEGTSNQARLDEIARLQDQIKQAQSAAKGGAAVAKTDVQTQALGDRLGLGEQSALLPEQAARIRTAQGQAEDQLAADTTQRQRDLATQAPASDRFAAGGAIRSAVIAARNQTSDELGQMADQLGLNTVDMTVPFQRFASQADQVGTPRSRFDDPGELPPVFHRIQDIAYEARLPNGRPVTFQDVKSLRERVGTDIRDELSKANPDRKAVRNLVQLRQNIDGTLLDASGPPGVDQATAQAYQQFRSAYFDKLITPFETGPAFKVRARDGTGFYRTQDEQVADTFLASQSGARKFWSIFQNDPAAVGNMRSVVLDKIANEAVDENGLNLTKLRTFVRKNGDALGEIPPIATEVQGLVARLEGVQAQHAAGMDRISQISQTAQDDLLRQRQRLAQSSIGVQRNTAVAQKQIADATQGRIDLLQAKSDQLDQLSKPLLERQAQLKTQQQAIDKSVLMKRVAQIDAGTKTADQVIAEAVQKPAIMQRLINGLSGDKASLDSLKREAWNSVANLPADAQAKFMADHRDSLTLLLGPQHMSNLRAVQDARRMLGTTPEPLGQKLQTSPGEAIKQATGANVPSLVGTATAIARGRSSPWVEGARSIINFWNQKAQMRADALMTEANYNPDVAKQLADSFNNRVNLTQPGGLSKALHVAARLKWLVPIATDSSGSQR